MTHKFWKESLRVNTANRNTVSPPQPFPTSHADCGNNEVKGEFGVGVDGQSTNCNDDEIKSKVGEGGNGLSANFGNNEVEGKVKGEVMGKVMGKVGGGGGRPVRDGVCVNRPEVTSQWLR